MARARNIKPSFFQNEELGELNPIERLAFIGMWTIADFKGCLEMKLKRLKVQLLPYDECDMELITNNLERSGFISIYSVQGQRYIKIINFEKHQNPHKNERESGSEIPDITQVIDSIALKNNPEQDGTNRADSLLLIPSSLIPDSPIPPTDSPIFPADKSAGSEKQDTELQIACKETWASYSQAFFTRYGTDPVRNATVNSQVKQFVRRLGFSESPQVASWFLEHTDSFYIRGGHTFGMLAKDAEKLRTEWATGRRMNGTKARQVERSGSMVDAVNEILSERNAA